MRRPNVSAFALQWNIDLSIVARINFSEGKEVNKCIYMHLHVGLFRGEAAIFYEMENKN